MRRRRKTILRWATFAAILCVCAGAYLIDARLKRWPDNGFTLNGDITLAASDFPGFWRGVLDTTAGGDAANALSRQIFQMESGFRRAIGIRPTPARWSLWLGERILVSHKGDAWLACLRPGALFRMFHTGLQCIAPQEAATGIENWGGVWGTWRDGYFLVGSHPHALQDLMPAAAQRGFSAPDALTISLQVSDESPGAPPRYWALVSIRPIEGLPVTAEFSRKPPPPRQPIAWPAATTEDALDNAIVACQIEDLDAYQDLSFHVLFWPDIAGSLWWQGSLPPPEIAFDPAGKHYAAHLVLFDLPASAGEMLLHTGASFYRREGPWDAHPYATDTAHPPLVRIPYAWNTVEGFLLPLLGEDFTFGCAVQGNWAHLANPKENLARLLVEEAPPVQAHPAFRARIRWDLLGPAISSALRQRQQLGQLPGDPRAFDADYGCWTDAVKALGTAQLASVDDAAPEMFTVRGELALRKGDAP